MKYFFLFRDIFASKIMMSSLYQHKYVNTFSDIVLHSLESYQSDLYYSFAHSCELFESGIVRPVSYITNCTHTMLYQYVNGNLRVQVYE